MSLEHRLLAERELDRILAILKFRQPSNRSVLISNETQTPHKRETSKGGGLASWASGKLGNDSAKPTKDATTDKEPQVKHKHSIRKKERAAVTTAADV